MKKNFLLIVCAVALVLGFSSCGSNTLEVIPNVDCSSDANGDVSPYCGCFELVSATPVTVKINGHRHSADDYNFIGSINLKKIKDVASIPESLTIEISLCNEAGVELYRDWINAVNLLKMDNGSEMSFEYRMIGPEVPVILFEAHHKDGDIVSGDEADDLLKEVKKAKVEIYEIR